MGKHGINAPPGVAVTKIEDLLPAAKKMADSEGEVFSAHQQCCDASSCMHAACSP